MGVHFVDTHQDPSLVGEIPQVFQIFLKAEPFFLNCVTVEGRFFVECFHGDGDVVLACWVKCIPCICFLTPNMAKSLIR